MKVNYECTRFLMIIKYFFPAMCNLTVGQWVLSVSQKTLVSFHYPEFCGGLIIRGGLQQRITLKTLINVQSSTLQLLFYLKMCLRAIISMFDFNFSVLLIYCCFSPCNPQECVDSFLPNGNCGDVNGRGAVEPSSDALVTWHQMRK